MKNINESMGSWFQKYWWTVPIIAAVSRTVKDIGYMKIRSDYESLPVVFSIWFGALIVLTIPAVMKARKIIAAGEPLIPNRTALNAQITLGISNILAYWAFLEAMGGGDFSLLLPLRNLVPLFSLILGVVILKEKVNTKIVIGTLLVILGTFYVFGGDYRELFSKSSILATLSAFIFAVCAIANKKGAGKEKDQGSMDPLLLTYGTFIMMSIGFGSMIALGVKGSSLGDIQAIVRTHPYWLVHTGVLGAIGSVATFTSFKYGAGKVTTVVPLLRAQIILSVLVGIFIFHEPGYIHRIPGALVLTSGIVMIMIQQKKLKDMEQLKQ